MLTPVEGPETCCGARWFMLISEDDDIRNYGCKLKKLAEALPIGASPMVTKKRRGVKVSGLPMMWARQSERLAL